MKEVDDLTHPKTIGDINGRTLESYDKREFICGLMAAMVNINLTFPISKVIFRQMLYGVQIRSAIDQLRVEGLRYLYRGIGPPLMARSCSASIMFGTFAEYRKLLDTQYGKVLVPTTNARFCLAAMMAGSTEALLTPFERIQMLLQDNNFHKQYKNTLDAFLKLRQFGLHEYYRGLTAILCRNGPSNVLFFTLRGEVKQYLPVINSFEGHVWYSLFKDFISGACVGALISSIFYPINVIRTQMQTRPPGSPFVSIVRAFRDVYHERDRSIRKMFYGVHVNYSRAFISWGIINASYEVFRKLLYN
ncbi:mitochondrial nicotinamide adenine dinucleotide transporter SLC25A51-like [Oppia nitens]|uniref:mitochondrial nicotinamide adenine dinucleotide transporter SLC25A51-like n=1 Tax=Oppia nitens TaxID=1686743 RepID=UPI0023DB40ED|nr:mitochondrial nicotinamide adenine dinucleotide transporter SLC25A51-like [Oppia nitens]